MIRVGPAGWTHPGLAPLWPPAATGEGLDPLGLLARYFDVVEADATAHAMPRPAHVERWRAAISARAGTRLVVRVPSELVDLARPGPERLAGAARFRETLAPLVRRRRLGAAVAVLDPRALYGPAETRALADLARELDGIPLVLEAAHRSWYASRSLDALSGAGWSLAHLVADDRWDAPPERHRPTGPVGMLRVVRSGGIAPPGIGWLARRALGLANDVEDVYVVTDNGGRAGTAPAASLVAALEIAHVLAGEQPVPAWKAVLDAYPHLRRVVRIEDPAPMQDRTESGGERRDAQA
ncbi:MAG: DUF72 domain-containing protein [Planctomycetota bacterium]